MPNATQKDYSKINKLPVFAGEQELTKFLESNFTESLKQFIRLIIKTMIKNEMDKFRKEMDGLIGKLYFNGCYPRNMTSSMGEVKALACPGSGISQTIGSQKRLASLMLNKKVYEAN